MTSAAEPMIRLLLVDDHDIVRSSLRLLLESHPRMCVVGEAGGRVAAVEAARATPPDIVLLDLDLDGESGLDLLPELRRAAPAARIVVLTGKRDARLHRQAVQAGAAGLVLKGHKTQVLMQAIETVAAGRVWLDTELISGVVGEAAEAPAEPNPEATKIAALTERELQVISLICEGLQNKQIASRLSISENTVRHHLTSIFKELGIDGRLELVIYAYQHGLAQLPDRSLLDQATSR